jgi:hypothetical protein
VDELVIDENGDIGIGTDTPMVALDVVRALGAAGTLFSLENDGPTRFQLNNTTGDFWLINASNNGLRFNANANPTVAFTITACGNLSIAGSLTTAMSTLPDYVFEPEYPLMPLDHLEAYILENKHLPNIPAASDVEKTGRVNMTELQVKLLEKVEELTLYTLAQDKQISEKTHRLTALEQQNAALVDRLAAIERRLGQ